MLRLACERTALAEQLDHKFTYPGVTHSIDALCENLENGVRIPPDGPEHEKLSDDLAARKGAKKLDGAPSSRKNLNKAKKKKS